MVSGVLIEQLESALLTENQLCSVGETEFLSYINMFRVMVFLLVGVMHRPDELAQGIVAKRAG